MGTPFYLRHLQSVQGRNAWYSSQRFVGRGGNGTTFQVTCTSGENQGLQFALKVLHNIDRPERRQAFDDEVEHLRQVNHPAIVRVHDDGDFTVTNDRVHPFVVMDFIPTNLREQMDRGLDRLRAVRYAMHILSALNHLHSRPNPLVHRDIKPANILIHGNHAKLADFGLVRVEALDEMGEDEEIDPTQWPGMPKAYRTPEQVARANHEGVIPTSKSDIFQFGTVLHEMLVGWNPQKGYARITDDIDLDLGRVAGRAGGSLTDLIASMLAHNPNDRPSARDCLQRLNVAHKSICESLKAATGSFV